MPALQIVSIDRTRLTWRVTAGDTSVAFMAVDGQIVTFSLNSTNATFTGTDRNTAQALKPALKSRELSLSTRPVIRPNRPRTDQCRSHWPNAVRIRRKHNEENPR